MESFALVNTVVPRPAVKPGRRVPGRIQSPVPPEDNGTPPEHAVSIGRRKLSGPVSVVISPYSFVADECPGPGGREGRRPPNSRPTPGLRGARPRTGERVRSA